MLYCKDCEEYKPMSDKIHGVCSLPDSWFPTKAKNLCAYLKVNKQYCKDCSHFIDDYGCMTQEEYDEPCGAFTSLEIDELKEILFKLYLRGENVPQLTNEIINDLQQSKFIKFINKHKRDIIEESNTK